jgi:DNA-binding transcriptional ArsR family regulator
MKYQKTLKALADPTRRDILMLLKEKSLSAGEIVEHFKITGATVSHHLSILKEAGLVRDRREGKYIYYEINLSVLEDILTWLSRFMEDKDEK